MSQPTRGQDGHLDWWIDPNTINLVTCFLSSFIKSSSAFAEEKLKMSQTIRGQDSHLGWCINTKNINLLEEDEDLLPVKFRQILFSNWRGEVKNVCMDLATGDIQGLECWTERTETQIPSYMDLVTGVISVNVSSVWWYPGPCWSGRTHKWMQTDRQTAIDRQTDRYIVPLYMDPVAGDIQSHAELEGQTDRQTDSTKTDRQTHRYLCTWIQWLVISRAMLNWKKRM